LKSFLEWWATIGELQRHCWIWGLERKGLDGCGCGLRHNYGCCPCLICNLYFSRDAAAIPSQYPVRPSPAWCFNMAGPQCWTSAWARIILYLAFSCDGLPPQYTPSSLHSHGVSAWRVQMTPVTRMVFQRGGSGVLDLAWAQIFLFWPSAVTPRPSAYHKWKMWK
jgi:hypothetical protein